MKKPSTFFLKRKLLYPLEMDKRKLAAHGSLPQKTHLYTSWYDAYKPIRCLHCPVFFCCSHISVSMSAWWWRSGLLSNIICNSCSSEDPASPESFLDSKRQNWCWDELAWSIISKDNLLPVFPQRILKFFLIMSESVHNRSTDLFQGNRKLVVNGALGNIQQLCRLFIAETILFYQGKYQFASWW